MKPSALEHRPGVYMIMNIVTKKRYVGSTINVYKRYYRHRQVWREQINDNIRMLEDAKKYGVESFVIGVIEYCEKEYLLQKEQLYFEKYKPEYNVWKWVFNAKNRAYTKEQIESFKGHKGPKDLKKFSEALKEAWKKRKAKFSAEELSKKMAEARRGIKHSEETKKKFSETRKGKKKPESMKENIRKFRLGTKLIDGKYIKVT